MAESSPKAVSYSRTDFASTDRPSLENSRVAACVFLFCCPNGRTTAGSQDIGPFDLVHLVVPAPPSVDKLVVPATAEIVIRAAELNRARDTT
ncbi:unnamed protein product [Linum trigynum]|uniref:Uncharacterized protein n=1 Tax=Linum trigynum TaxID=586398 RepID=A0AAV2DXY6_9ROSI